MGNSYKSKGGDRSPFDFDIDGEKFVCTGGISLLDLSELARVASSDIDSPEGAAALAEIFRGALEDDYERFRKHTRAHNTDPETFLEIMTDLVEYKTAGPTERPSQSSHGPLTMNGSLPDTLQFPGLRGRESKELTPEEIENIRKLLPGAR